MIAPPPPTVPTTTPIPRPSTTARSICMTVFYPTPRSPSATSIGCRFVPASDSLTRWEEPRGDLHRPGSDLVPVAAVPELNGDAGDHRLLNRSMGLGWQAAGESEGVQ